MRKSTDQTIGKAIEDWLKESKLDTAFHEKTLIGRWPEVMGPMVASRTTKLYIHNKVLFVSVESASLRQELVQSRHKIIQLLNEDAGAEVITGLVIR